ARSLLKRAPVACFGRAQLVLQRFQLPGRPGKRFDLLLHAYLARVAWAIDSLLLRQLGAQLGESAPAIILALPQRLALGPDRRFHPLRPNLSFRSWPHRRGDLS